MPIPRLRLESPRPRRGRQILEVKVENHRHVAGHREARDRGPDEEKVERPDVVRPEQPGREYADHSEPNRESQVQSVRRNALREGEVGVKQVDPQPATSVEAAEDAAEAGISYCATNPQFPVFVRIWCDNSSKYFSDFT